MDPNACLKELYELLEKTDNDGHLRSGESHRFIELMKSDPSTPTSAHDAEKVLP